MNSQCNEPAQAICNAGACTDTRMVFVSIFQRAPPISQSGADFLCNDEAQTRLQPGTYKAWLSTSTASAASTMNHAQVPYIRADRQKIADNWADLTDGSLDAPILLRLTQSPATGSVWTGTLPDGTSAASNCNNFSTAGAMGTTGLVNSTSGTWTNDTPSTLCSTSLSFICVEQ
ncbi:MAG: hypothetical protein JNJ54_03745 [Myxococcaceae bacterium]|nr:hypothetical protein [Myxococcaceae bacterium]